MSEDVEVNEEAAFRAALEAVSKKFEAKIPTALAGIAEIRSAIEQGLGNEAFDEEVLKGHVDDLLKKSHTLAGSAGQFGHPELTAKARAVEELCLSIKEAEFKNADSLPALMTITKDLEAYEF